MKTLLLVTGLAFAFTLTPTGRAASVADAGLIPGQPSIWCRFDGDTKNLGAGKAQWGLQNTTFQGNTLYLNGKYRPLKDEPGDGYRAICQLEKFDKEKFTVALRFKRDRSEPGRNIVTAGTASRWFGISLDTANRLELTFNDGLVGRPITGVELRPEWNWLVCSVDLPAKKCAVLLNGMMAAPIALPPDFVLSARPADRADNTWSFTNYADTRCFCGWVDEFLFYERELTAPELTGLAHRREMLEPKPPALTTPPPLATAKGLNGKPLAEDPLKPTAADRAERPGTLSISSVGTGNSIAARIVGTYSWNATHVKVKMKQVELIRQAMGNSPERKILGFHLFLARTNPAQKFLDYVGRSEKVAVDTMIGHGQTVALDDVEVEIPVRGVAMADLGKTWLGVWIDNGHPTATGAMQVGVNLALSATCLNGEPRPADPAPASAPAVPPKPLTQVPASTGVAGRR